MAGTEMIRLTRLNHVPVVLNSDLIEHVEITPDTVISLTTGQKIVVLETAEEVVKRIVEFRHAVLGGLPPYPVHLAPDEEIAARTDGETG